MPMRHVGRKAGFTIVELLIVIVVIAILAAITVVAYTGVQNSAYDTAVQSDLKQIATKVELYKAEKGTLPRFTEFQGLSPSVTKSAYGVMWTGNGYDYNVVYCSPSTSEDTYALVATSKSGQHYYYGATGNGKIALVSAAAGSSSVCSEAGAPISSPTDTNRQILYQAGWLPWVRG